MAGVGTFKVVEEIENNGYWNVGFVGLMNGVDESPVVFQPLIPEHPVNDRTRVS